MDKRREKIFIVHKLVGAIAVGVYTTAVVSVVLCISVTRRILPRNKKG